MYLASSFAPMNMFPYKSSRPQDSQSQAWSTVAALKNKESILSVKEPSEIHQIIHEVVQRQMQANSLAMRHGCRKSEFHSTYLDEAYEQCRKICAQHSKTYYLGTLVITTKERQRAIWAIYAWCRRTDDIVDCVDFDKLSSVDLDGWEARLEDIFSGRPHDMLDAALTDTIFNFSIDIKPFKDMLKGMRMDTNKNRYANFQELYLYSYYVTGTPGLMIMPVLGIAPESPLPIEKIYASAIDLCVANQLTNVLRDVGDDAAMGRVYLPQDELAQFGISNDDIFSRKVTNRWREFMKQQIKRVRFIFQETQDVPLHLEKASRWPVLTSLMICNMILEEIESNNYDNLTKTANVGGAKKLLALPLAYVQAQG